MRLYHSNYSYPRHEQADKIYFICPIPHKDTPGQNKVAVERSETQHFTGRSATAFQPVLPFASGRMINITKNRPFHSPEVINKKLQFKPLRSPLFLDMVRHIVSN